MTHNIRCEHANPKNHCKCSCHGKYHGIRFGESHLKKQTKRSKLVLHDGQTSIDEFIEEDEVI